MPKREKQLSELIAIYRDFYDRRVVKVSAGSRVSQEEKAGIAELVLSLDRLRLADPFPEVEPAEEHVLRSLHDGLSLETADDSESRKQLLDWAAKLVPSPDTAPAAAPSPISRETDLIHPGNLRMLNNLHRFKTGATSARIRLLREGSDFDAQDYKEARIGYTIARAAYEPGLKANRATASTEQNVRFESDLLEPLTSVTGPDFVKHVTAATAFVRHCVFGPDTFVA